MTADDEVALLAAIRAQPDEDTPRLAYADWLDEHANSEGERARAELIRVQIKLARANFEAITQVSGEHDDAMNVVRELRPRDLQLLSVWGHVWFADAFPWAGLLTHNTFSRWWSRISRGFVSNHELTAAEWVPHGDDAVARQPVRLVRLTTFPAVAGDSDDNPEVVWLAADRKLVGFAIEDVFNAHQKGDPDRNGRHGLTGALLRMRWPGIKFTFTFNA